MPPWVARQWHVCRALHSAPRAWCRYQRLSRCPSVLTSRSYAQTSTLDDNSYTISTANSAIIIPRSVNTQPEDLISHIQPVDRDRLTRDRFAVFFVTPAFASWLLDDEVFLRKALRQTYAHLLDWEKLPYARIHALCAVVDKLPTPKAIGDAKNLPAAALERMKQPPVSETGHEGMAYTTLRFHDSVIADALTGADEKAAISFITSERVDASGDFGDALRLPLANTVFQTGLPSTMTYSTWSKRKGESDLVLKEKRNVTHHGIRFHQGASIKQCISTLAVPLIPLTVPRRVDASMGNILRRVIGPAGTSVAASQELERIVPQYYNARGESPQATSVWALLIPKELMMPVLQKTNLLLARQTHDVGSSPAASEDELWEGLWKRDPTPWNDLVPTALASSARLHRVLSGGGGWGKKAGLLSLDPVATTEDANLPTPNMSDEPSDLSCALHQVAHNGDYIQFFISPSATSPASNDPEAQSKELKESVEATTSWGWELGTIPSTVDSFPGGSWQHEAPASKDVFVFKHSFGALAEGGLTLYRQFKLKSGDVYSFISGSKVDVPFSRFSAVNTEAKEEIMEEDYMQNFFNSKPIQHHSVLVRRLYGEDAPRLLGLGRLDTSSHQQQPNRLGLELPPEDWEVAPVRKITIIGDGPNLATQTKLEPKLAIHKVPAKDIESLGKQPSTVIRYVTYTDEVDYYADKLRQGQKIVQRLTHEYRTTMNTIVRSNKRPMDLAVKRLGDDSSKGTRARIHQTQDYINKLAMKADSIDVKLYRLQKEFRDIINAATQRVLDQLLARVQQIIVSVAHLRNEFARVLNFMVQHAHLTHYTNNSAVTIYQLHISLRWRLGDMIFTRRQYPHSHPMAYSILPLEEKLVKMRAYGSNLFYGRKKMSVPYVRQQLIEMEGQNLELRNLKLSEPAEWRGKIAALPVAEQIERNRNARLGRVTKNDGLKVYENIGKALNAMKSRHIAFSPSDEPSVRDRRKSRRERERLRGRSVPIRKTGYLVFRKTASSRRTERIANKKSGSLVIRKTFISRRREEIANEKRSLHEQLVRKKALRRWLADTVSGWLGSGDGEEARKEEHDGWDSAERAFGGSGKYDWFGQGGGNSSSEIPLHNDADLLPEVQREGGYSVGSYGQQTPIEGPFRGDFGRNIDSLPSDGGDDIFLEDVGKLTSFRPAQDRKDAFSTNVDRPAGFLPGQGGGDPFTFSDNDDELRKMRRSKK